MTSRALPDKVSLVFCDVDGTLVTKDKRLTQASRRAVRLLRDAGIRFAIGSSRPPRGMAALVETLALDTPVTAFNGGLVTAPDGRVLARHLVPRSVGQVAIELFEAAGAQVWVFTLDGWLLRAAAAPYVAFEELTVGFAPTPVVDFGPHLDEVGKIVAVSADFDFLARCESEAAGRLGAAASVVRSQAYYLDVTNPQANKAEALRLLAAHCAVARDEVVAIGDGLNDVGMLREAAFAIAMGNASEKVRSVADFVTASNEEDGFAKATSYILDARRQATGAFR